MFFKSSDGRTLTSDLSAALKGGPLLHAESLGLNVALEERLRLQLASVGINGAFDSAIELHFTGLDVAFDAGVFGDGHLALVGNDFAIDLSIDDHVVGESNRSVNLYPLSQDVGCICHNLGATSPALSGRGNAIFGKAFDKQLPTVDLSPQ